MEKYFYLFIISMLPIIELRGAIPIAMGKGLPLIPSYLVCILGNMLPVPLIFFLARKILNWGGRKRVIGPLFTWCLDKGQKNGEKLQSKGKTKIYWALAFFVGIPIPGTGAWTGTLAASLLNLDFKKSSVAIMAGVLLAGIIMLIISLAGIEFLNWFL